LVNTKVPFAISKTYNYPDNIYDNVFATGKYKKLINNPLGNTDRVMNDPKLQIKSAQTPDKKPGRELARGLKVFLS